MIRPRKALFAAGGTGGHIFPALAIAEVLGRDEDIKVLFIGGEDMELSLITPNYPLKILPLTPIKRFPSRICEPLLAFLKSIFLSFLFLLQKHPHVVVGMGGYPSLPPLVASLFLRIPIVIHEQNVIPGRVNRLLALSAKRILISFPETARFFPASRTKLVGLPLRSYLRKIDKTSARQQLDLLTSAPTILISGGSRGALTINQAVVEILPLLLQEGIQVIHICGAAHYPQFRERTKDLDNRYLLLPFTPQMHLLYSAADLCITRAGASTLAELAFFALPSILIPYPYATAQHQFLNASLFQKKGASRVLLNETLKEPRRLYEEISSLLASPQQLAKMSECAHSLSQPEASVKAANEIKEVMKR